ncbi:MAG: hypothetical protein NT154_29025, partial [Verrucomicrobia bacterium]|nr:hypothetical protein [Verrucomicrobiota bacterium]
RYNCCNQRSANVQFTIMDGASNVLWTAFKGPDYVPNGPWLNNTNLVVFPEVMGQIVRIAHPVGNSDTLELSEVAVLGPSSGLCITAQPVSQTVLPGKPVTFSVAFSGTNQPITFQWKHEGTNIPGATTPTLSIPSAGLANAGSYSVVVADSTSRQRTSATALLSLIIETVPPTVTGQVFTFNRFKDELKLGVKFSEQVDPTTATNPANYLVVGAGTLTNGVLNADGQGVTFYAVGATVGCANYTLNVSGLRDIAGNVMVPTNLAGILPAIQHSYPGGTVTASSAYDIVGFGPLKARDGDLTTTFITSFSGARQEYWELDLGTPASIGELDIWFRYDTGTDNNSFLDFTIMDAARTPLWTNAIGADILPLDCPNFRHSRSGFRFQSTTGPGG